MTTAAIQGTFADYRTAKGRGVLQLIIEVPLEGQEAAYKALGYPLPGEILWVAVARIRDPGAKAKAAEPEPPAPEPAPAKERQRFDDLPPTQQAGILCGQDDFQAWLHRELAEESSS